MELTLIECCFHGKAGEGRWDLVYDSRMPSGARGKIVRLYEFKDRDTISDEYHSSPDIAEELRAILAKNEDTMDVWESYFSWPSEGQIESPNLNMASYSPLVFIAKY